MKTYEETTKSILSKIEKEEILLKSQMRKRKTPKYVYVAALLIFAFASFNLIKDHDPFNKKEALNYPTFSESNVYSKVQNYNETDGSFMYNDIVYKLVPASKDDIVSDEPFTENGVTKALVEIEGEKYILEAKGATLEDFQTVLQSLSN